MIRTTLFSMLALGFASAAFAQSPLDDFEFPQFNESSSQSSVGSAPKKNKLIQSDAGLATPGNPVPLPIPDSNTHAPTVQGEIADPLAGSSAANHYSGMGPAQPYQPFNGYMSYGPSPVTPMLGYMTCTQNMCPNIWASFPAEHAARMAHYCSKHDCAHCGCGGYGSSLYPQASIVGAGHHHKLHHNRYTQPAAPACDNCTSN